MLLRVTSHAAVLPNCQLQAEMLVAYCQLAADRYRRSHAVHHIDMTVNESRICANGKFGTRFACSAASLPNALQQTACAQASYQCTANGANVGEQVTQQFRKEHLVLVTGSTTRLDDGMRSVSHCWVCPAGPGASAVATHTTERVSRLAKSTTTQPAQGSCTCFPTEGPSPFRFGTRAVQHAPTQRRAFRCARSKLQAAQQVAHKLLPCLCVTCPEGAA